MQRGKVLAAETFDFEQRNRERIPQGQSRRGAGRGRQRLGTSLLGDAGIEHHRRRSREGRVGRPGEGDVGDAESFQLIDQTEELL